MLRYTIAIALVVGGIAVASPAQAQTPTQLRSLTRGDVRTSTPAPAPARQAPLSVRKAPKAAVASTSATPSATISRDPTVVLPEGFGRRGEQSQRAQPVERGGKSTRAVRVEPAID